VHDLRDDQQVTATTYEQLPSGTVTFLMTDIEGSTRLWETYPGEMDGVLTQLEQMVADSVAEHGGHRPVEQGEGDSAVAVFRRPGDASSRRGVCSRRSWSTSGRPASLRR
jgi:class 3 adenylate cyclase